MMELYNKTSFQISRLITKNYSTSFSLATSLLNKEKRNAIYSIYGFVRYADEIVDVFHQHDKKYLLAKFESDYYEAFKHNLSLNPVLHSFQNTVKKYNIPDQYVQAFLNSMKYDYSKTEYNTKSEIDEYIYGSADVVGLMCLKVFCDGEEKLFRELELPAKKLGSAFQKVNFLRDLRNDMEVLNRKYFPDVEKNSFDENTKLKVINDIESDFKVAHAGIKKLPGKPKLAVIIAYYYYLNLLNKLKKTPAEKIIEIRIRISNFRKICLLTRAIVLYSFNLI